MSPVVNKAENDEAFAMRKEGFPQLNDQTSLAKEITNVQEEVNTLILEGPYQHFFSLK